MAAADFAAGEALNQGTLAYQAIAGFFGHGWESILTGGELTGMATATVEILRAFNLTALAMTSAMILWTMTRGAVGTANEGSALGRSMSTFWTPMRSAMSVGMLVPLKSGLSALQILILVATGLSIQGADYLSGICSDLMVTTKGAVMLTAPASVRRDAEDLRGAILQSLVMQEYFSQIDNQQLTSRYRAEGDAADNRRVLVFSAPAADSWWNDADGSVGTISLTCPAGLDSAGCTAQVAAIDAMITALEPVAQAFVAEGQVPSAEAANAAVDAYVAVINSNVEALAGQASGRATEALNGFNSVAREQGFFALGSFYWTITQINHRIRDEAFPEVQYTNPDWGKARRQAADKEYFDALGETLDEFNTRAKRAHYDAAVVGEEGNGGILQGIAGMVSAETWAGTKLLDAMADGDPVYVLADLGGWISGVTGSIMTAVFVADTLLPTGVMEKVPVIGKKVSGLKKMVGYLALPVFIFFILGILLQYYLPAVPYIVWITGVCGWLLLLLEAVCAAPVWCLAHGLPGHEDGMVTGRSGQGYMLLVNILMRPPLMVAAFFLSFGVLAVVTPIVASTLKLFLFGLMGSNAENQLVPYVPSLPRMAMSIVLVAVVMGVVIHKVFQLVTVLPDRVIRWVGGHAENLGEAEAEQKTRTAVVGVTRQAGNAVGSGAMRRGGAIGAAAQRAPGAGQGAGDAAADLSQAMPGESGGHAIDGIIPTGGNDDTLRGR